MIRPLRVSRHVFQDNCKRRWVFVVPGNDPVRARQAVPLQTIATIKVMAEVVPPKMKMGQTFTADCPLATAHCRLFLRIFFVVGKPVAR
jgi:hypothetical protein